VPEHLAPLLVWKAARKFLHVIGIIVQLEFGEDIHRLASLPRRQRPA